MVYREPTYRYSAEINFIRPGTTLLGYFQSPMYFASVGPDLRESVWAAPASSPEFHTWSRRIASADRPIAVHVRRGDYLTPSAMKFHGVPTRNYYERAIIQLQAKGHGDTVFLFSDDPAQAMDYLDFPNAVPVPLEGLEHPLDTLRLLAQPGAKVLSNSSFSWWAGWLGPPTSDIVVPHPWFAAGDMDVVDLVPPTWSTLDSRTGQ
jgi:hypothetical protein